jgi:hypothetical protein
MHACMRMAMGIYGPATCIVLRSGFFFLGGKRHVAETQTMQKK